VSERIVVIARAAEGDIADAFLWYRERNALVAEAFRNEVFETIDRIAAAPMAKAADEDGNRKRVLRRFPYTVLYEVTDGNSVTILAVAHHRRSPSYWRDRRS
jgi:plasmid stabilization system protein ParE